MSAGMFSTGPAEAWMTPGTGGSPVFIGNFAKTAQIDFDTLLDDHACDLAGTMRAFDRSYQGKRITVSGVLTFMDPVQLLFFNAQAPASSGDPLRDVPGDRGTLMMTENGADELFIRFPFVQKFANVGLIAGFHFLVAIISRQTWRDLVPGATTIPITWTCEYDFDETFVNNFGWGAWTAGDYDMSSLPAAPSF